MAGLDPEARQHLIALLQELPQAMLIASHDLDLVRAVCQRALLLDHGRIVAEMPAASAKLNP